MPVFKIQAPSGVTIDLEGDAPPTEQELDQIFASIPGAVQPLNNTLPMMPVGGEQPSQAMGLLESPLAFAELGSAALGNVAADYLWYPDKPYDSKDYLMQVPGAQARINERYNARPGAINNETGEVNPQPFTPGESVFQPYFAERERLLNQPGMRKDNALERTVVEIAKQTTTPGSIGTLGAGALLRAVAQAQKIPALAQIAKELVATTFLAPMVQHAPEASAQAGATLGTLAGTPANQLTEEMVTQGEDALMNEVINKLTLGAAGVGMQSRAKGGGVYDLPKFEQPKRRNQPGDIIDVQAEVVPPRGLPAPEVQQRNTGPFTKEQQDALVKRFYELDDLLTHEGVVLDKIPYQNAVSAFSGTEPVMKYTGAAPKLSLREDMLEYIKDYGKTPVRKAALARLFGIDQEVHTGKQNIHEPAFRLEQFLNNIHGRKSIAGSSPQIRDWEHFLATYPEHVDYNKFSMLDYEHKALLGVQQLLNERPVVLTDHEAGETITAQYLFDNWKKHRREVFSQDVGIASAIDLLKRTSGGSPETVFAKEVKERAEIEAVLKREGIQYRNTGPFTKEQQDKINATFARLGERAKSMTPEDVLAVAESAAKEEADRGGFALSGPRIALGESGFKSLTKKVDAKQLSGRIQNLLKQRAPGEWEIYNEMGVWERLEKMGEVSPEEAGRVMQESGPKVEVRKFGEGNLTPEAREYRELQHWWDTGFRNQFEADYRTNGGILVSRENEMSGRPEKVSIPLNDTSNLVKYLGSMENVNKFRRYRELGDRPNSSTDTGEANWSMVAPKPESEMPGYVEIAVVRPQKELTRKEYDDEGNAVTMRETAKFGESHNFPPNTLGFGRGYMSSGAELKKHNPGKYLDVPDDAKVFFKMENQSDWMKDHRERVKRNKDWNANHPTMQREVPEMPDKLLPQYERLVTKAMMQHAQEQGATHFIVQDAESAMMMEGHDRAPMKEREYTFKSKAEAQNKANELKNAGHEIEVFNQATWEGSEKVGDWTVVDYTDRSRTITQEGGMRLHYDKTLQSVAKELTGKEGERVSLGEHKMAVDRPGDLRETPDYSGEIMINAVIPHFKTPSGEPKTDVSGKLYSLPPKGPKPSLFEKDKPSGPQKQYLYGGLGPIPTPESIEAAVKALGKFGKFLIDQYALPMSQRLGEKGGKYSKATSVKAREVVSRAKAYYGQLTPTLDPAKKAVSKAYRGGTTWMRGVESITDSTGVSNMTQAINGKIPVPPRAQDAVNKFRAALHDIELLEQRVTGKAPSGKMPFILTNYGLDLIRRGHDSRARRKWAEGWAKANAGTGATPAGVLKDFDAYKEELDKWSGDASALIKLNRALADKYPNMVTHVKPFMASHEVVMSDPFTVLEQGANRIATQVAFPEVFQPAQGTLAALREQVMKELDTTKDNNEFDKLMRALQGHPLDTFNNMLNAPDSIPGGMYRMGSNLLGTPLKAMMLTGSAMVNIPETFVGGPMIFFGPKYTAKATFDRFRDMPSQQLYEVMERLGIVNKAMQNWAFDPSAPARSVVRQGANALRSGFFIQWFNELQEFQAARSAMMITEDVLNGRFSKKDVEGMVATMRVMGMTEANARKALAGDQKLLAEFIRDAAAKITSGHQHMADKSRMGVSRVFNELVWYQSYSQTVFNQFAGIIKNLVEDKKNKNWEQGKANLKLLGKFLTGRAVQGALVIGLTALASYWFYGTDQEQQEAEDELWGLVKDSYVSSMGGPLAVANRMSEVGGDSHMVINNLAKLSTPVSLGAEAWDAGAGNGKYEGRDWKERLAMFAASKTPGLKPIKMGLVMSGLVDGDIELDSAKKGFYKWRREVMGWRSESEGGGTDKEVQAQLQEDAKFRAKIKDVLTTLENGGDWRKKLEGVDPKQAAKSIYARTLVVGPKRRPLTDRERDLLKQRIGAKALEKLELRDAMVRELARNLADVEDVSKIEQPTGVFAMDRTTESKREENVGKRLAPDVAKFLKENKMEVPGYTPMKGFGKNKVPMTVEEGKELEELFVKRVNTSIQAMMFNPRWDRLSLEEKQKAIRGYISDARENAQVEWQKKNKPR